MSKIDQNQHDFVGEKEPDVTRDELIAAVLSELGASRDCDDVCDDGYAEPVSHNE